MDRFSRRLRGFTLLLIFVAVNFTATAQESTLTGVVTDADNEIPIAGASIVIQGKQKGTVTDFDGNFTLNVHADDVILVSYIGYETKAIPVNGRSSLQILLKEEVSELQEVIVTGYTSKRKSEVTSSVATVDAEELTDVVTPNVSTMLQGKASGVQVVQSSGQPGSTPSISIRGLSSINGNVAPLWVVDGMIMHTTPNINPVEINSISVLKDASATALYGSRGANGVIVVTTKQGTSDKATFSLSSRVGYSNLNQGNFEVMNSGQLYDHYLSYSNQENIPAWFDESLKDTDYDWFDNGTQTGMLQDYSMVFTGGTEKSKTFASLGYYNETGTVKGYDYDRVSFRLNHSYDVNDRLTLKPRVAVSYEKTNNQQHSLYAMYTYLPWDQPYDEEGNVINPQEAGTTWYGRDASNYLYDLQWNYSKNRTLELYTNFDFEYDLFKNVKFISTNGVSFYYTNGLSYTDPSSNSGLATNGSINKSNAKRVTNFTNQMLKYSNNFGKHYVNALVAYEYNDYKYESDSATGYGIVTGTEILGNAATPAAVDGLTNDYALQSYFFNGDYSYDSKYMAQVSVRRDGASNFGADNQYGTFYSGSLGWNIHNEDFFKADWVDQLKLRVSYGSVGNRPSSLYPQYDLYSLTNVYDGYTATTPSQLGNDDLSWEKSYLSNFGIDTRFFNRINFSAEYYIKDTSDLLYYVTLPSTSGYTGYWENIGGVKNKGFEASVYADIITGDEGSFTWSLGGNIGFNKNEITELYEGAEIDRGTKVSREGEDYNSWFMRKWMGVDPENGDPLWEVVDSETGEKSVTNDYNAATKQIVGTSSPDFYGGFTSYFDYKGFSLSTNFNFVSGGKIYNYSRELYDSDGAYPTYNQQVLYDGWSRWEEPGDIATHPKLVYGGNNLSNKTSSRYLEDASYLRLRNIQLGYSLPSKAIESMGITHLGFYVSGDNLFTFTDFSGMDPEVGSDGYSSSLYPVSKRFTLGINVSF
ncbi:SusC/RagA family TonB-linked outer membrane protein [Maribacter thermophilus]|uniref:SusC/RagA family TonB-linked outer membrane protein n=1 Tax=Maribacter thermophilus TaxID=1197874 RepID=UPI000A01F5A5|nr:TonB-dependent receptor [Maribacter thermophilus]